MAPDPAPAKSCGSGRSGSPALILPLKLIYFQKNAIFRRKKPSGIYYTCSKIRLTENVFVNPNSNPNPVLTLIPTVTLKHNNIFGLTKWRYFSSKCTDASQAC